jgi:hypothetical protein
MQCRVNLTGRAVKRQAGCHSGSVAAHLAARGAVPGVLLIAVQNLAPAKRGRRQGLRQRKGQHARLLWSSNVLWRQLRGCFTFGARRRHFTSRTALTWLVP